MYFFLLSNVIHKNIFNLFNKAHEMYTLPSLKKKKEFLIFIIY